MWSSTPRLWTHHARQTVCPSDEQNVCQVYKYQVLLSCSLEWYNSQEKRKKNRKIKSVSVNLISPDRIKTNRKALVANAKDVPWVFCLSKSRQTPSRMASQLDNRTSWPAVTCEACFSASLASSTISTQVKKLQHLAWPCYKCIRSVCQNMRYWHVITSW